jgi:hypothetical protein
MSKIFNANQMLVDSADVPVVPSAPEVTTIVDAVGPQAGYIAPTGIATDTHPTIQGTGQAGDTVNVYDNTTLLGTTVVGADGKWHFQPVAALADGAHSVHATSTNAAGTSGESSPYAFSTTQIMMTGVYSDGVLVPQGGTTSGTVTVTGWIADPSLASKGLALYLSGGNQGEGTLWGSTVNGAVTLSGNTFTAVMTADSHATFQDPLSNGTYRFDAKAVGDASSILTVSDARLGWTFTDNFSAVAPSAPEVTTIVDAVGPHAGYIAPTGIATDTHPTIQGTGQAGDTIKVYDNTTLLGTTVVGADGKWHFQPVAALGDGAHSVHATSTNAAGTSGESSPYTFGTTQIMVTGVYSDGVPISQVGTISGTVTVTGWIADPSLASRGVAIYLSGGDQATGTSWEHILTGAVTLSGNSFTAVISQQYATMWMDPLSNGTYHFDAKAFGNSGSVTTASDAKLGWTFTDNLDVSTAHTVDAASAAADAAVLTTQATASAAATQATHHTAVGVHDGFKGTIGNETADLNTDPTAYFKQATAHVQGSTGGIDTLHLSGDHQVLDLSGLSGKTAAAKVSGIESIDLGGHSNTLKLSLTDVLNLAEPDLFQKDGKNQMMVSGSHGDAVDLSNAHIAGVADGQWAQQGTAQVSGVTYNVYEHSGAHTELLVQQGVQIALHN